jgi:hypothetical protein
MPALHETTVLYPHVVPQPYESVVSRVAESAGTRPMTADEAEALLALARRVAHSSDDRRSAPLVCYVVGAALAGVDDPAERLERISDITALFPDDD